MATVEEGLASQLRNIETSTGRSIQEWTGLIRESGLPRHREIMAWLKDQYGLSHGTANRLALVALAAGSDSSAGTQAAPSDPVGELYAGAKAGPTGLRG